MKPSAQEGFRLAVPEFRASRIRPLTLALVGAGMAARLALPVPDVLAAEVGVPVFAREAVRGVKGSAGRVTGPLNDPAHVGVLTSQPMVKSSFSYGVSASLYFGSPIMVMQGNGTNIWLSVSTGGNPVNVNSSTLTLPSGLQVASPVDTYVSPGCGYAAPFSPSAGSSSISFPSFSVSPYDNCAIDVAVSTSSTGAFGLSMAFSGIVNGYGTGGPLDGGNVLTVFAPPSASVSFSPSEVNPYGSTPPTSSSLTLTFTNANPYQSLNILSGQIDLDGLDATYTGTTCGHEVPPTVSGGALHVPQYGLSVYGASCTVSATVSSSTARSYNVPPAATTLQGGYYSPSAVSRKTGTFSIPVSGGTLRVGIPSASLSPLSLTYSPPRDVGTTSGPQPVTLTNAGTGPLSIASIGASGDFASTHNCGSSLPAASSCTISTTFTPTNAGARTGTLSVASNAAGSPHTVGLSGTGTAPSVSLTPPSLSFGSSVVGAASSAQAVTLANTGTGTLAISGITAAGDFSQTNGCGTSLAAGNNCTISVTFVPTLSGARTGTLSVASNATGTPHTVSLAGTGTVLGPTVSKSFNPSSVQAGAPSVLKVTLSNPNGLPLSGVGFTDTFPAGLTSNGTATNTCAGTVSGGSALVLSGGVIQANGGCEVGIPVMSTVVGSYTNTLGVGAVTATLNTTPSPTAVSNAAAASAVLQVSPVPAPGVSFTPTLLSFGSATVGTVSGAQRVTIANSGTATLNFSGPFAVTGPFAHVSACPTNLVAEQNCTVDVKFAPTAEGPASGALTVASNAPGSPHSLPLSGTGAPQPTAGVSLVPASLSFGAQTVNTTSVAQTVVLGNTGTGIFTLSGIATTGDFGQSSNCTATLAPGTTCLLNVTFRPVVEGTRTGRLQVASNAPGSPHAVSLTGQGEAPPVPGVALVPGTVSFPDTQVGTSSAGITVEVRNSGNAPLQVTAVAIVGGGFRVVVHDCTRSLSPGGVCRAVVVFEPTTRGAASGALRVESNAPSGPVSAGLVGVGIPAPVGTLAADPGSLAFDGQVIRTTSAARSFTVNNTGTAVVTLNTIEVSGDFAQTNNCGTLQAGTSCTVSVTFTPAAEGARAGSLSIRSNASNGLMTVGLSGTGLPLPIPVIELSASSLSWGNTMIGSQSSGQTVTVRNSGGAPLAIGGVAVVGDFEASSGCPGSLAIGGSCDITVLFSPHVPGTRNGTLAVQSNASNAPSGNTDVGLSGIGCRLTFTARTLQLICQ